MDKPNLETRLAQIGQKPPVSLSQARSFERQFLSETCLMANFGGAAFADLEL